MLRGFLLLIHSVCFLVTHVFAQCNTQPQWIDVQNGTVETHHIDKIEEAYSPTLTPLSCIYICLETVVDCFAMSLECSTTQCHCVLYKAGGELLFSPYDYNKPMQFYLKSTLVGQNEALTSAKSFYIGGMPRDYSHVRVVFTLPSVKINLQIVLSNNDTMFYCEIRVAEQLTVVNSIEHGVPGIEVPFNEDFNYEAGRQVDMLIERQPGSFEVMADLEYLCKLNHRMWNFDDIETLRIVAEGGGGFVKAVLTT